MVRLSKPAMWFGGACLGVAAIMAVAPWAVLMWERVPSPIARKAAVSVLAGGLALDVLLALAAPIGAVVSLRRVARARRLGQKRIGPARLFLVCVSIILGLALVEGSAAVWWAYAHRLPGLPTRFQDDETDRGRRLRILVVGESSACGVPYEQWVSMGHLIGWKLKSVFPERPVEVEMVALGGVSLDLIFPELSVRTHRPDIVLVFAGHNEFQAHHPWNRTVPYYDDQPSDGFGAASLRLASRISPLGRMVREAIETRMLDAPPPRYVTRQAVDMPCCTPEEAADRLLQYRRRLDAIAAWSNAIGALPILVVPASNEGGFEPNRSVLAPGTNHQERETFAQDFQMARELESRDPTAAMSSYRALIARQPQWAEAHFRLARLCQQAELWDEARQHDIAARDLDAMPQRCRTVFQDAVRQVAATHRAILVDAPKVLRAMSPHGLLDDHLFHDAHHPTLLGYIALAQDALRQMQAHGSLHWPATTAVPILSPVECARHFRIGLPEWVEVCRKSSIWYKNEAYVRFDPTARLAKSQCYLDAADRIASGEAPESVGLPDIGLRRP